MSATDAASVEELDRLAAVIDRWLAVQGSDNPMVLAIDRDVDGPRSWFVRLKGEEKDVSTVRFWLRQRTLVYETFFMPAPEENHAALYEHLLRRNQKLFGASFAIGEEDAIYLRGQLDHDLIGAAELDRVLGSLYQWVEQYFRPALRIGFASKFS
ncbi:MAG: YbjN domain-containing protein [Acidimicrobiales bacterium]